MSRAEFSAKTKVEAFASAEGRCQGCTAKLSVGNTEYDHGTACGIGGSSGIDNCIVLCRSCHRTKTSRVDLPRIAKAKRNHRHHAGIKKPRTITRWRRMNGEPVIKTAER